MISSNFIDFGALDKDDQELVRESIKARENAYAPYSQFKVGAALRCEDETISRGCNVENASYPVGACAERVALGRAISDGKRKFKAISVAADLHKEKITSPCGMCRQALAEFGDVAMFLTTPDMRQVCKTSLREMLPMAFGLNDQINKHL